MKNLLPHLRHLVLVAGLLASASGLWSCNTQTAYQKQLAEHENQLRVIDEDTIRNYLTRKNLLGVATRTASGLYTVPITTGTGAPVTTGRQVSVKYIGRFLSNGAHSGSSGYPQSFGNPTYSQGAIFDNSADNRSECACAVYTAGGGTIKGFTEGLLLMRKGDRKLLLLPSRLAYGPSGSTGIPPDSALMFDVEILDVY